jgi:hypothetical protein
MEKKNCNHKQKKEIIDNLFDIKKDNTVIDILPPLFSHNTFQSNHSSLSILPSIPKKNNESIEETKTDINKPSYADILMISQKKSEQNNVDDKKNDELNNTLMINQSRTSFSILTIEEIHLNFKTLGRIKEHDKMYLRDSKFLEVDDSYLQMVSRTVKNVVWNGYNREDIIDFLLHLTEQTMKLCDTLMGTLKCNYEGKENTKNILTNLLIDMEQSIIGLQKNKITYYNDNAILTRLDMIIDKFDKKIREIRDFLLKV